jgi:hypothetical protein
MCIHIKSLLDVYYGGFIPQVNHFGYKIGVKLKHIEGAVLQYYGEMWADYWLVYTKDYELMGRFLHLTIYAEPLQAC